MGKSHLLLDLHGILSFDPAHVVARLHMALLRQGISSIYEFGLDLTLIYLADGLIWLYASERQSAYI